MSEGLSPVRPVPSRYPEVRANGGPTFDLDSGDERLEEALLGVGVTVFDGVGDVAAELFEVRFGQESGRGSPSTSRHWVIGSSP